MPHEFPPGIYKIINFANGDINAESKLPVTPVPVVAAPEGTLGRPANLEQKNLLPGDKGIVAVVDEALPNVWCLHPVDPVKSLWFRKGTEDHGPYHWQLLSSDPGTNVIVDDDHHHPINKLLHGHIIAGLEASLEDLTEKLKGLHEHHRECFWVIRHCD
ncbi:hypothetical protein Clacol_010239 [Clathrus columnatus]|uniref:Uncharacterized protein n=1 Tax=Clathrus columnatus TaxID=1419009 RepID=A0AAV5ANC1_9AGAM|nr:hypothetical protein Clacol_010239 [Clathrus columnatus]